MTSFAFNAWQEGKLIDTVFFQVGKKETIADAIESVRNSLINHDGYSPSIRVTWPKGQRLTEDVWELHGDYGQGYELLCAEMSFREAKQRKKEYAENAPCPMKIICKRERK